MANKPSKGDSVEITGGEYSGRRGIVAAVRIQANECDVFLSEGKGVATAKDIDLSYIRIVR